MPARRPPQGEGQSGSRAGRFHSTKFEAGLPSVASMRDALRRAARRAICPRAAVPRKLAHGIVDVARRRSVREALFLELSDHFNHLRHVGGGRGSASGFSSQSGRISPMNRMKAGQVPTVSCSPRPGE